MSERPRQARTMTPQEMQAFRRVQRRVVAIGFFMVAIHGVLGLVVVAEILVGQDRRDDAILLVLMSGVLAIVISVVVRVILACARPFSWPWALLSLVPTAVGLALVL